MLEVKLKKLVKKLAFYAFSKKYLAILALLLAFLGILLLSSPPMHAFAGSQDVISKDQAKDAKSSDEPGPDPDMSFEEKIVVVARMPGDEEDLAKTPASVTIITADEIRNSGARTVQELLSNIAGMIFFDDVGNGVEATMDMRGFNEGTAAAVLLDGVRINEPDDNRVNLEQIPLSSIGRIEIYRGSSSSAFGAGALSGTVNIITNEIAPADFIEMNASYGSHDTGQERFSGGFNLNDTGILLDMNSGSSDGFRENSDYRISNIFFKAGGSYGRFGDLSLSYLRNRSELGAPGSLAPAEMEQDRYSSPYNSVDGTSEKLDLITLRLSKELKDLRHLSATLFYRSNGIYTLTTGRWLMGFDTRSDILSTGFASQFSYQTNVFDRELAIDAGAELQMSSFSSKGYFTDDQGTPRASTPDSWNDTDLLRTGIFAQSTLAIGRRTSILAGVRYDRDDLDYRDLVQQEITGSTAFSEMSSRIGITINPSEKTSYYLLYSEAFLPPTVYDLFAFPLFGSNPDLKPSKSRDFECGVRKKWSDIFSISASLFRMKVKDEVVFVLTDPVFFIGKNENVGKSRRDGLEISSLFRFTQRFSGFLNYTYMNAELASDPNRGKKLPLVPQDRISAGLSFKAGRNHEYLLKLDSIYVGRQHLSGDDSNSMKLLDAYTLVNSFISRQYKNLTFFIAGKNLLDEKYETRGITNGFALFFTPAPGRTITAGIVLKALFDPIR